MVAFVASALLRPSAEEHGLTVSGTQAVDRVAIMTSNDRDFEPDTIASTKWVGYLYHPRAAEVYFHVPAGVKARLVMGGDVVYDTFDAPATSEQAVSYPAAGFNPIAFEIATLPEQAGYVQAGLEWQTPLGTQLVSADYLYPQPTNPQAAQQVLQLSFVATLLGWLGVGLGLAFVVACAWPLRVNWRTVVGLTLIVALAFALRLAFLRDYTLQPGADVQGIGSDNRGYQSNAIEFLRGHWPPPTPFYMQPGISLWFGAIYSLFGPNIRVVQLIQFGLGALASVLIFDAGRRTFDSWTGWAAALLWAIFPLPIFYEAQLLTHGLEPIAGIVVLFLWIRSLEMHRTTLEHFWWLVGLGLGLGVAALLRPTFLILAPFVALSHFFVYWPSWKHMLGWPLLLAVVTCLPIAPITIYNYQHSGRFQLLTSNSDVTLYLGNNRDSTGLGEYSPAFYATQMLANQGKTSYIDQTIADIRSDPQRWGQLMLRKTFLYLGDPELPNNVDFYSEGLAISPTLAALPLRFGALMALGLAGMLLAPFNLASKSRTTGYWLLVLYFLAQLGVTIAYHVFSRFRAPVYGVLPIFAAFAIRTLLATLRQKQWGRLAMAAVTTVASGAAIWYMPTAAETVMSQPVVAALPANAITLNTPIGEGLTLIGYDPLPAVAPGDPLFVTLYWQSNEPMREDSYGTVQLFGGDFKAAQADQAMGTGSFPDYPTSQWQAGQIVKDVYFIRIPGDAPTPLALNLLVAVYNRETGERRGETAFGLFPLTKQETVEIPSDAQTVNATIGTATLNAYTIHDKTLTLYWQAGESMAEDGVIFVHLFDANNNFVAGADSRPRNGTYSTLVWQSGEGILDEHTLPDAPAGKYTLKVGVYDAASQARLPVVIADGETMGDGVLVLGEVEIP